MALMMAVSLAARHLGIEEIEAGRDERSTNSRVLNEIQEEFGGENGDWRSAESAKLDEIVPVLEDVLSSSNTGGIAAMKITKDDFLKGR